MNTFPWKYELSDHACSIYAGDLLTKYTNVSGTPLQIEAVTDTMLRIHTRTQESFAVENRPAGTEKSAVSVIPCICPGPHRKVMNDEKRKAAHSESHGAVYGCSSDVRMFCRGWRSTGWCCRRRI